MTAANPMSRSTLAPGVEALAAIAHELRLPLSHIKGFVSAVRRTDVEWDARTRVQFLADIEVEADRLGAGEFTPERDQVHTAMDPAWQSVTRLFWPTAVEWR